MKPQLCSRCKKHIAVVYLARYEGEKVINEGLCLKCAKEMGLPANQIPFLGDITEESLDAMDQEVTSMIDSFGGGSEEDLFSEDGSPNSPVDFLKRFMAKGPGAEPVEEPDSSGQKDSVKSEKTGGKANKEEKPQRPKYLDMYCQNLTERARQNKIDAVIGREKEIFRVIQILSRRTKNNPCLIGEPGVGKTAIAEGIALKIAQNDVPEKLSDKEIYLLDITSLVAGTQFRGQFESRVKGLLSEIKKAGNVILVIDEVHMLVGTGDSEGTMSAANMLKPALSRGEIQVIGATTLNEYRKYIEKDSALERRFQTVVVEEPSLSEAVDMIKGIKKYYEAYHHIRIPMMVVQKAVELSERYISDRYLPDKAIDLLDEACSNAILRNPLYSDLYKIEKEITAIQSEIEETESKPERDEQDYKNLADLKAREARTLDRKKAVEATISEIDISIDDLVSVIELWTGIPASKVKAQETEKLMNLEQTLSSRIIGQEKAIASIAAAVRRGRVSLLPRKRPISFIFTGPTGVGKTELVKILAKELFDSPETLIRLDMSEFMEKHSVSRIIGAPPGYIGYDDGGQLTEKIRRKPYSVILFDEIEKAHPDVLNILLQVLDDGRITDTHGKTVSFEHAVIVMTSNAGSNLKTGSAGFGKSQNEISEEKTKRALAEFLRPEFLNRVDEIIAFLPLPRELFEKIVEIHLNELIAGLNEKEISVTYSPEALQLLAEKSYSPEHGARNVRRVLQREIEDRAVSEICKSGANITSLDISTADGNLSVAVK